MARTNERLLQDVIYQGSIAAGIFAALGCAGYLIYMVHLELLSPTEFLKLGLVTVVAALIGGALGAIGAAMEVDEDEDAVASDETKSKAPSDI